ncbi:MAG: undecaprenyl-diphosphate phosphatase, partial [Mogibacterium sp.]|nr:undecaprenyl-diphosphate phosphatase [Mogibacterium sp.]
KLGVMIIAASIPTGIIGVLFNDLFESFYTTLIPTAVGLLLTGCLLWFTESRKSGTRGITEMNFRNAFFIGIMQGIAICPGISRSGATLTGGLLTRLDREFAVKFAFLISIPSILGSLLFEGGSGAITESLAGNAGPVLVGALCATLSGIFAIRTMIAVVRKHSLKIFSVYVWIVGAALILSELVRG